MNEKNKQYLFLGILILLVGLLFYKVYQVDKKIKDFRYASQVMVSELKKLKEKVESGSSFVKIADPSVLQNGLYILKVPVLLKNKKGELLPEREFEVYHIKYAFDSRSLNIGIAVSGISKIPVFYMDYDSDGLVDLKLMEEFVAYIPMANLLKRAIEVQDAQAIYNSLCAQHEQAKFFPPELIQEKGGVLAGKMLDLIENHYQRLEDWVLYEFPRRSRHA